MQQHQQSPRQLSRREFLTIIASASLLAGCGGGGGSGGGTSQTTALAITEAAGYQVIYDPDLSTPQRPFVSELKVDGQTVMSGPLYFTVNGQPFHDGSGPNGDKSVITPINHGDRVEWHVL